MNAIDMRGSIGIDGFTTVPSLFWDRVTTKADKVAMREKDRGVWKAYTWGQYGERAEAAGLSGRLGWNSRRNALGLATWGSAGRCAPLLMTARPT